jgi:hypothetical protein|tara:strand:+ start:1765 stop:2028 length:264 start_codon:yes stop_codon:yes gene_type:complete
MMENGWEGVQVLDQEPINNKDDQFAVDKSFARTFDTEEGKKVLDYLVSKTLNQPTWLPGGDHTFGYAREGQNSIIREIQMRIERAKQ